MTAERWQRVEQVFYSALDLVPEDRSAFIQNACAGDAEVLWEVERLLDSDSRAHQFLETPPFRAGWGSTDKRSQSLPQVQAGDRLGPYRVEAFIGAGGMGEVYRATDVRLERLVAVKVLPQRYVQNDYALERFHREARAVSALNHPNICTLYDIGDSNGQPFLVMELLDGRSLKECMSSRRLSLTEILDLGIQVAEGLEAAHARRIIHRDIQPANIFITTRGDTKILDFGLAKVVRDPDPEPLVVQKAAPDSPTAPNEATTDLPAMGTLAYMSPEQVLRGDVNPQTDLFSFGVMLYRLVTGTMPFHGTTPVLLLEAIVNSEPPEVRKLNPSATVGLERIITKALQKDRAFRYQSAAEMRRDLDRLKRPSRSLSILWTIAAAASVVAAVAVMLWLRSPAKPPDRSEWAQITNFPDSVTQPALSRDGHTLTFVRGNSTFVGPGEIYLKKLPAGEPIQLTRDNLPKMNPVLSPDGSRIVYTALTRGYVWDTWAVPVSGGTSQQWLRNASGLTWTTSQRLLFSRIQAGEHMTIVAASENGSDAREVYVPPHDRGMAHRSYPSPDGKNVLLTEMDNGEWLPCRVVPFDARSSGKQIGPAGAPCTSAAWSPDGNWIYVGARARDNFHLWRQRYPEGKPEQITSGPTAEEGIAVAPDGRSLITSVGLRQRTVKIHDPHGERQVSVEGYAYFPMLSPDGRHLYYRVLRDGTSPFLGASELWTADLETGHNDLLLPSFAVTHFRLSPDGKRIVFSALDSDHKNRLWIVPADGHIPPQQVPNAEGDMAYFGPQGELIYHGLEGNSTYAFRIREDGTSLKKLTKRLVSQIQGVSPDGKWVITMSPGGNDNPEATWACPTGGGEDIKILDGLWQFRWQPDATILYVSLSTSMQAAGATGRTYVIQLAPGKVLPPIPAGGFRSENELVRLSTRPVIEVGDIGAGPNPSVYVFSRETVQRNLYRIPLR